LFGPIVVSTSVGLVSNFEHYGSGLVVIGFLIPRLMSLLIAGVRVPRLYPVTDGLELATGNNEWEIEVKLIFISHKPVLFTDGKGSSPMKSRLLHLP
jgi:hypothetical protein